MMLSSAGQPDDVSRARRLGISRCLTKPVKSSALLDAISRVLTMAAESQPPAEAVTQLTSEVVSRRILLAEDGLINQKVAVALLEQRGHEVTLVRNGKQAVEAVETGSFDAVLMDVEMPEMDGLAATAAIRKREELKDGRIRIIAMTAHAMKGDRERFLDAGMDGYIAKPIEVRQLYEAVESAALESREGSVASDGERPADSAFDRREALRRAGGEEEVLRDLIELFCEEYPKLMDTMREAISEGKATELERAAHTLKGALLQFAARPAADAALHLERLACDGDLSEALNGWKTLEAEISRLLPELVA
jgi:CheY-like chemotaxis protein/HPt (histidine-containing phosphotransfer) domain-containing protein